jgi:cation transport ATPase/YHS domain-containing protein
MIDHEQDHARAPETAVDPVCGMAVAPGEAAGGSASHGGTTYHFCSARCRARFEADPGRFVGARRPGDTAPAPAAQPDVAAIEYTCPMHPEIIRSEPGSCPICGMALEPRTVTAEEGPSPELRAMTRRFWVSLVLTLPVFVLGMSEMIPGQPIHGLFSSRALAAFQLLLAAPVVLWGGWPFFARGWSSIVHRSLNMFTLIAMGTGSAFAFSVFAVVLPGLVPAGSAGHAGRVPVYFEAAAVITTLVLMGQVLELRARHATTGAIKALLGLAPKTARRIDSAGREADVSLASVEVGDRIRVRPGEKVPLLAIADPVKESTPRALKDLTDEGLRIVMLTGDHATTASAVARRLGIGEFEAGVLPDRKADVVKRLQAQGHVVAVAGDGINDAPALAQAEIGIAMGSGTDIAVESASITLVKGDLGGIVKARRLSRATLRNIRQNLFFAFVYNALGVPVAAGVLYPVFGLLLSPMIASAAMSLSSVSVIANALRLRSVALQCSESEVR